MKLFATILILAAATAASAQEAQVDIDSTFFHPAASLYIHGNTTSASNLVAQGLSEFPDNGKLLRLKELLEKQQEQDQEKKDDQQQQQNQDQQQDEQLQDQEDPAEQEQEQQEQPEPQSAEQMTEDEAKQLLDAMRQEEKNKRLQLHPVMGAPVKVDKDW